MRKSIILLALAGLGLASCSKDKEEDVGPCGTMIDYWNPSDIDGPMVYYIRVKFDGADDPELIEMRDWDHRNQYSPGDRYCR